MPKLEYKSALLLATHCPHCHGNLYRDDDPDDRLNRVQYRCIHCGRSWKPNGESAYLPAIKPSQVGIHIGSVYDKQVEPTLSAYKQKLIDQHQQIRQEWDTGTYISKQALADKLGCSIKSVQRALAR